ELLWAKGSATVCIWNESGNDVFALGRTNSSGVVIFADLEISQTGNLTVTATKRRDGFDVASYTPGTKTIAVNEASGPLVCMESVEIDDDNTGSSQGSNDGVINPGETIELFVSAENSGSSTANYVSAQLNIVSGGEHIENVSSNQISFPDIPSGTTRTGNSPFVFAINENVESYSSIQFEIEFSYNLNQTWESPYCCSIFSESYSIPLVDIDYSQSSTQVTINMDDFLLVNTGIGAGLDLEMTVGKISPSEPFSCNTITNLGALSPDEYLEIGNQLTLVITPDDPSSSPWRNPAASGCSFDIQVSSSGGDFAAKGVDFDRVCNPGAFGSLAPPEIIEADDNSVEIYWALGTSTADIIGFYLYFKENGSSSDAVRSTSLPIPVSIGQLTDLEAETDYKIYVQAVDEIGRQSSAVSEVLSTTCEVSDGWPIQLEGGTGTGPVIVNMDSDAEKEIVVASSFGNVYIIGPDGHTECISPPPTLSFDRFVGLSVGDVDNDNDNEIIVSCQKDIVDGEVAVLIYDETDAGIWQRNILDDTIGPNETVCGAAATGTPVILQANDSFTLEIALRTKGSSTALHMWYWNSRLLDWVEPTGFPISLSGDFFTEPIAVDFDDDGYDELIVSQVVNNYSTLHVVDFYSGGFSEYDIRLTELGTSGRVYSTLAAVEYDGEVYIAGVARYSDSQKKVFVYDITAPNTGMIWYSSNMQNGQDFMGNMGGPAIGHANTDGVPDIFYALDGMTVWQLLSEQQISNTGQMSINVHSGCMYNVKSATIAAGTSTQGSIVTVPFVGYSSKYYGHDPLDYMDVLPGFPTWTETPSWTAPAVGDVDGDGFYEVLTANASGELTLYDWNGKPTSNCWPMYQHDSHRTGFFNSGRSRGGFDIELVETNLIKVVGGNACDLFLTVKVAGADAICGDQADSESHLNDSSYSGVQATESVESCLRSSNRTQSGLMSENSLAVITPEREIPVAVFSGRDIVGAGRIPLVDGLHEVTVLLRESVTSDILTVVVDPYSSFPEVNEANNSHSVETEVTGSFSDFSVSLQSPSDMISATVVVPDGYTTGISFTLYSLDGRLQSRSMTELLIPGTHRIDLFSGDEGGNIPSGVYLVHINIADEVTMIRKVVVL
ncbi:MAG: hypothetical protein KAR40_11940, partial [Candidatus Sabulitectum sp.]|nr:hypothetical protein [Candidatus Sabulitectum sp.]